jgi:putative molybdopterin biosynthesis protein
MAVAAAVQGESADAGLGVLSAANAMGLDFIPVNDEEYDFAVPAEFLELQPIQSFILMLKNPEFLKKLDAMGGYSHKNSGEVVLC